MIKRQHLPSFKFKVVMESFQRDSTVRQVSNRFGVGLSLIHKWRKQFRENGPEIFNQTGKARKSQGEKQTSTEELERIIGSLTVENQILKKVSTVI